MVVCLLLLLLVSITLLRPLLVTMTFPQTVLYYLLNLVILPDIYLMTVTVQFR